MTVAGGTLHSIIVRGVVEPRARQIQQPAQDSVSVLMCETWHASKGSQMSEFLDKATDRTDSVRDKIEDKVSDSVKTEENVGEELADNETSTEA